MLTILGVLLGFLSSSFPDLMRTFRESKHREHELKILDHPRFIKSIPKGEVLSNPEVLYEYENDKYNSRWVVNLRASVRPLLTYSFFIFFVVIKLSAFKILVYEQNVDVERVLTLIWDPETQALFSAVISFWFGSRAFSKIRRVGGKS